ncbi:MAG: glycosyl transferase [Clostridiales bacterium]|nr:glycosyl transferase [Clostridiales bacterium]
MIPKTIHYCWFGRKPLPSSAVKCIESWKKILPDYDIRLWNEDNFDVASNEYVKEAYEARKWAFVTDYVRLYVLVNYGGIYMDSDVEVIKPIDSYLKYKAFSGFQTDTEIPTGIMACEKGFPFFEELLNDYDQRKFKLDDGTYDDKYTNVDAITESAVKKGLILDNSFQIIDGFALFPKDYFCAKDYETRKILITENTVTIHHFAGSWTNTDVIIENKILDKTMKWNVVVLGHIITSPLRALRRLKWRIEGSSIIKRILGERIKR